MTLAPYEFHRDGRRDLAEMIILHEYPISMVEHMGFRKYSKTLQPGFKVPSRNTTRKDIMKRYELEKENVATLLRKAKGKIALTTDMFLYVPAPHTAEVLADALKESIHSWNLDLRLSSIIVDNCSTNDAMMEILKGVFPYSSLLLRDKDPSHEFSELDKYLDAGNVPLVQDFDILNWLKTNGDTYPILQQITRDILSIPVSTVALESAFSTSGRVLNPYRSRLLPKLVEALMCTQNWIWATLKDCGEFKDDVYAKLVGELEEEFETWDIDSGTSGVCTE
uniref:HAT C-terminal dimerisation domain-containing protein n=1 Tax=Chenopodium quinoa TaxID=63459 RepID=A0A803N0V9_CHEQI